MLPGGSGQNMAGCVCVCVFFMRLFPSNHFGWCVVEIYITSKSNYKQTSQLNWQLSLGMKCAFIWWKGRRNLFRWWWVLYFTTTFANGLCTTEVCHAVIIIWISYIHSRVRMLQWVQSGGVLERRLSVSCWALIARNLLRGCIVSASLRDILSVLSTDTQTDTGDVLWCATFIIWCDWISALASVLLCKVPLSGVVGRWSAAQE